jgi:hypothetical protein
MQKPPEHLSYAADCGANLTQKPIELYRDGG